VLTSADRLILEGPPSGELDAGGGRFLRNRYERTFLESGNSWRDDPHLPVGGGDPVPRIPLRFPGESHWDGHLPVVVHAREEDGTGGAPPGPPEWEVRFDPERLSLPLFLSPVSRGSRIRTPGSGRGGRKVQDLFTDRKIPRDERWGRCAVTDSGGEILWIPGVAVSSCAPADAGTPRLLALRASFGKVVVK
jgi:tRNA(Ile)-lysidine synthetase-like protein